MGKIRTYLYQTFKKPVTNRFTKPKMTPEARQYIDNFSNILETTLDSSDELFESNKHKPMLQFLEESDQLLLLVVHKLLQTPQ